MRTLSIVLALSSAVFAQGTIIAVSWAGGAASIDPVTGVGTALGATGAVNLNAMAGSPLTGVIYAVARTGSAAIPGPAAVYTINPGTGAATNTGVPLTITDVRGLAFDSAGVCYAIVDGPPGLPDTLHTVDLVTGVATLVGPTGYSSIQALAADASGALFAWNISNTTNGGTLLSINPSNGAGTVIGTGTGSIQGLSFSASGVLYGCQNALYTVSTTTGATTLVGSGGYNDVRGIEFTPVPGLPGTVTFNPSNGQVTPGGSLSVLYNAPTHPNEAFVPIVSCSTGATWIPGLPQLLPIALDACTDFYFNDPAALLVMPLSGVPGSYVGALDASGFALGLVLPPLGVPPGLNLPVHVTYVTAGPFGFKVHGVGTFILN